MKLELNVSHHLLDVYKFQNRDVEKQWGKRRQMQIAQK